jgi:Sel1 repeat
MKIATRVWVAAIAMAIAAVNSPASAAELSGSLVPASAKEEGAAQAQIWFERALSLDIGAAGTPNAVQAFAAMRHAAESGHTQAAFNVAVMLDSGRGAPRDLVQAGIWYARAAAGGSRRAAFNLGQLYESGEGVPANVDLSRAWYAAADLPAAREHLAQTRSAAYRPAIVQAPEPLFPLRNSWLAPGLQQVDLVWSSPLEPEVVRFFVELRILEAGASREVWSGFVDVSSVRLPIPAGVQNMAWRVTAVARDRANYTVSGWSTFTVPPS